MHLLLLAKLAVSTILPDCPHFGKKKKTKWIKNSPNKAAIDDIKDRFNVFFDITNLEQCPVGLHANMDHHFTLYSYTFSR